MSKGKYSPFLTRAMIEACDQSTFIYNAYGDIAPDYNRDLPYDEKLYFADYDKDGFDRYGYSAWNADGSYAGIGDGIDRGGYTEMDYLSMSDDEYNVIT